MKKRIKNVRLSKDIVPLRYKIQIKPDLENFSFEGMETITLSVLKRKKNITLHSKNLKIKTAEIAIKKTKNIEKIFAEKIIYSKKEETVTFFFKEYIPVGKLNITIIFQGILNDKMRGFYRSSYKVNDKTYYMATTQFEATDARMAFPCFDEPSQKAIFDLSLIVPKEKTVISNTLPSSILEHDSGYKLVKFLPTPKMSTYLLAFIVGDFEYVKAFTKNKVLVRVFTTKGKKDQAKFALKCAVKILEFYEKYFDIKYPLNTLDMVAIPDFAAGAMENWGLVTYRENALLVDFDHSSTSNKQWVALVVAHELAHQWFGNLVTMEWWTHLWLNEGFASYIEYLAVDKIFPKWDIWTQFATHDLGVALHLDALYHTHPIEIKVHSPNEIGEIFDAVSYSKGASIIRMLADYLGEKDFRDGLRYYLKKHSYKNTETIHLWNAFAKISKKPVNKIMKNWTAQSGYPVIKAELIHDKKNSADLKLLISQERFFTSIISKKKTKDNIIWQIPISVSINKHINKYMLSNKKKMIVSNILKDDYLKINIGESGFYRTFYTEELLNRLQDPIRNKELSSIDRLGIIRDLFALAETGIISIVDVLKFLPVYKDENNYSVWMEISEGLFRIEQLFTKTSQNITLKKLNENLSQLNIELFQSLFKKLGWEKLKNEKHTDTLLRSMVISKLGRAGDKKILKESKRKFNQILKGKYISPDIRGVIYSLTAKQGGTKEYKELIKKYKKERLHEEKNRIGYALGNFSDSKILEDVCNFAVSKDVRFQDTISIISSVGVNPVGRNVWLNFVKKNWNIFLSRYGDGGYSLARMVKAISASSEKKHFVSFKNFFKKNKTPGATRAIEQVLERMESNILWFERDVKRVIKFFQNIN